GRVLIDHQHGLASAVLAEDGLHVEARELARVAPAHTVDTSTADAEPLSGTGRDELAGALRHSRLHRAQLGRREQSTSEKRPIEVCDVEDGGDEPATPPRHRGT